MILPHKVKKIKERKKGCFIVKSRFALSLGGGVTKDIKSFYFMSFLTLINIKSTTYAVRIESFLIPPNFRFNQSYRIA